MDLRSLNNEIHELEHEFVRLKGEPLVNVPSILKLIEMEITRLSELKLGMAADDVLNMDEDSRTMIDCVSNEFDLGDASSVKLLMKRLMDDHGVLDPNFHPPLLRITSIVPAVVERLGQKVIAMDINTAMRDNPQDFHVDQIIEHLRQTAPHIDVDDEDIKNFIFQKCNEAIESRDKKLAQGDQDKSSSKRG